MNAEDMARECMDNWMTLWDWRDRPGVLRSLLGDAIRAAMLKEREECAKIAERGCSKGSGDPAKEAGLEIAREIRARE